MKTILRSMLALGALALAGCGDSTGPLLQPRPLSFLYACNTWTPQVDPSTLVLADLQLNPGANPSATALAVRSVGGRIVHQYNVKVLRAVLRAGDIPGLPGVGSARGVTDPRTMEVRVLVAYSRTPTEADVQALQARGGRNINLIALSKLIDVTVPDAAIPLIRQDPGVTRVEADGSVCAG